MVQSPAEKAQIERVNPQNGHGYPVNHRKVQGTSDRLLSGNRKDTSSGIPVSPARNRCGTATSQ
jgi:hypothetical protein